MKFRFATLLLTLAALFLAGAAQAEEKIRVLLTSGGHGFDQKAFYAMFDAMDSIEYTKAQMPKDADLLKPGLEKKFDVIAMYDMSPDLTPAQQDAFVALLEKGIGVVSMHHNLGGHRNWAEFTKIIGGKFIFGPITLDGKEYAKSTWSHGEDMSITIADKEHPITKGMKDFKIHDETYGGYYVAADVHVLATTDHPKNTPSVAWTKDYGKSRVFYLMLGHDGKAFANANYSSLIERGIRWTAGR